MRKQRSRHYSHRESHHESHHESYHYSSGGFGGAWAGMDSDNAANWGGQFSSAGNTAQDMVRNAHKMMKNMHQFMNMAGDFFNEGFSESPVVDSSQHAPYFDKWFPQVAPARASS